MIRPDIHDRFERVRRLAGTRNAPVRTRPAPRFLGDPESATATAAQEPFAQDTTGRCAPGAVDPPAPIVERTASRSTSTKQARYVARLRAGGRCVRCGGPPAPGRTQCARHASGSHQRRQQTIQHALDRVAEFLAPVMDSERASPEVRAGVVLLITSGWLKPRLWGKTLAAWTGWSLDELRAAVARVEVSGVPPVHWADECYGMMTFILCCLVALGRVAVTPGATAADHLWASAAAGAWQA